MGWEEAAQFISVTLPFPSLELGLTSPTVAVLDGSIKSTHFQQLGPILSTAESTVPRDPLPCVHHPPPPASQGVPVGNLRTHSTGSRALQDLAGVRLSFIARLLQRSWLARWRAWFRANKLLPGRCAPPPSSRPAAVAAAPAGFPQS